MTKVNLEKKKNNKKGESKEFNNKNQIPHVFDFYLLPSEEEIANYDLELPQMKEALGIPEPTTMHADIWSAADTADTAFDSMLLHTK